MIKKILAGLFVLLALSAQAQAVTGALNPRDNSHATTVRPVESNSGAAARKWYSESGNTILYAQDVNRIIAQMRNCFDHWGVTDVEGDDTLLQQCITAAILASAQPLDADLTSLGGLSSTGFATRTASNTWAQRSFADSSRVAWTNPAGVAGNPSADIVAGSVGNTQLASGAAVANIGFTPQALDATLTALAGLDSTAGILTETAADTFARRTLQAPAAGFTISNPAGVLGDPAFALSNDLSAVEAIACTGLTDRTATDTWTCRALTAPAAGITVTNGDGVAGNPTLVLANDLAALEGLASTGFAARTATDTWAQRTVTGSTYITATNGNGVSGDPTLTLAYTPRLPNLLFNGSFDVWQENTTYAPNNAVQTFVADRWKFLSVGTSTTRTVSRSTGFAKGSVYALRIQRNAASTSVGAVSVAQQVSTSVAGSLAGHVLSLTFDWQTGADWTAITAINPTLFTGTGVDENCSLSTGFATGNTTSSVVSGITFAAASSGSYSGIVTVPAGTTELCVMIRSPNFTGTAGTNDWLDIDNVKLEDAPVATGYVHDPVPVTLTNALRFYEKSFAQGTAPVQNAGTGTGEEIFAAPITTTGTERSPSVRFKAVKRGIPTMTFYNPAATNPACRDETAAADGGTATGVNVSDSGFNVTCTGNASTAVGNAIAFHWVADARTY